MTIICGSCCYKDLCRFKMEVRELNFKTEKRQRKKINGKFEYVLVTVLKIPTWLRKMPGFHKNVNTVRKFSRLYCETGGGFR